MIFVECRRSPGPEVQYHSSLKASSAHDPYYPNVI
jgi:hypothetical protein